MLLCREAPSLALPPEETVQDGTGGEAASLREAPLPQTPSPEERLAFELGRFCLLGSACEVGASPIGWVAVTAADRAAATMRRGGTNPSARFAGTSPFRGGFAWGFRRRGHIFRILRTFHTPIQEKPMAQAISFSCIQFFRPQRSTSAAALSAAVDSTNSQGTAPNSQAEPSRQNT